MLFSHEKPIGTKGTKAKGKRQSQLCIGQSLNHFISGRGGKYIGARAARNQHGHIAERLMLVQTAEASRAVADGIVLQAIEADVASVLGWGFPAARGGVFGQMLFLGMDRFVASAERLRQSLGPRFALAPWIHEVHAGRRALYHF